MTQSTAALRRESQSGFAMPPVTDRETWLRARIALLAEEKAATRGVTLDPSEGPVSYNYRSAEEFERAGLSTDDLRGDMPGNSIFLRDGDSVYHTYSAYARGLDSLFMPHNFLDLTPYGRQEAWEDSPDGWPKEPIYGPDKPLAEGPPGS